MGGEGQSQELKAAEKPSVRERVKNAFREALPLVAIIAVVGGGGGLAIGAGVRGCIAKNHEEQSVEECMAAERCNQSTLKAQKQAGIRERSELDQALIKNLGNDDEGFALAFKHLNFITTHYKFDTEKMALLRQLIEKSGANAAYSLDIASRLMGSSAFYGSDINQDLVEKISATVNLVAQKTGDGKTEALNRLIDGASTYRFYAPPTPSQVWLEPKMFGIIEIVARHSTGKDDLLYKMGVIHEIRNWMLHPENPGELAKNVCETVDGFSQKTGQNKDEALKIFQTMLANRPQMVIGEKKEDYQKRLTAYMARTQPEGMLAAVGIIAERSADSEKFIYSIRLMEKILLSNSTKPEKFDAEFANTLCNATDKVIINSSSSWKYAFEFLFRITYNPYLGGNPYFDFEDFSEQFAEKLGKTMDLVASRGGERTSEAMNIIYSLAGKSYTFGGDENLKTYVEAIDVIETAGILAERSGSAERLIKNLELMKRTADHIQKNDNKNYAFMAGKLCDLENLIRTKSNNSKTAINALYQLEDSYFNVRMVKLVEIAIGDAEGPAVAHAIDSLRKLLNSERKPFWSSSKTWNIRYGDYEEGDLLVKALFRTEKPNLERLINFAYGISAVGMDETRELYKIFGIEYFFRYPENLLLEVHKNADAAYSPQKPLMVAVFAKTDWNNSFYYAGGEIAGLTKYYKVLITETKSDFTFYDKINGLAEQYKKEEGIFVLAINGHGNPGGVSLGRTKSMAGALSYTDGIEVARLKDSFVKNPIIVFNSCSTGKFKSAIGGKFSKLLGAKVFAPVKDSNLSDYVLDSEGKITMVCYNVPTRVYYPDGSSEIVPLDSCYKK